jgi:hypothetical protein
MVGTVIPMFLGPGIRREVWYYIVAAHKRVIVHIHSSCSKCAPFKVSMMGMMTKSP